MAVTWTTPAGDLGILEERITVDIPLTATTTLNEDVTYKVISGKLPAGLQLLGNRIKGTPGEVVKFTESRFVIRASDSQDEKDRTFKLSVDGAEHESAKCELVEMTKTTSCSWSRHERPVLRC